VSPDEGSIRMLKGKASCKSPNLACQLSVFSAPANYEVVKITILVLKWSFELQSTL
jgi:hypothetical protein